MTSIKSKKTHIDLSEPFIATEAKKKISFGDNYDQFRHILGDMTRPSSVKIKTRGAPFTD